MRKARMTGIDYRREWNENRQRDASLKAHVKMRLNELIKMYPQAVIDEFTTAIDVKKWMDNMSSAEMITYIEAIEKWSAEQQPVIQAKIQI